MNQLLRPLRIRLAIAGFAAIYTPVVLLVSVIFVSGRIEESVDDRGQIEVVESSANTEWPAILITSAVLAVLAVALAWWWAGRAVRPVQRAIEIQEQLIEETSHELRTPLSVLSTNAEVLLSHPQPTVEVYRRGLERSRSAASRMTETIDSLLVDARGRARTIDQQPTDVARLAKSAVEGLRPLAAAEAVTLTGPSGGATRARINGPSVERAISNLITNAIEHAPEGSVVSVDAVLDGAMAVVSVTDQGPGISAEDQARIFERYWSGETGEGTGIGLAIVKQVAIAHGGDVRVVSPANGDGGTEFRLSLRA